MWTQLRKTIKEITHSSICTAKKRNKTIKFKTNIRKKMIAVDPFEIERILLNLLSNAFKFTDPGDTITVELKEKDGMIRIIVADTGIGISEKNQKKIFKKFSQADESFQRRSEGSGIGLSIVKEIVKMHDGNIILTSKPGQGSKFCIELPDRKVNTEPVINYKNESMIDRMEIEFSDIY